MFKSKISEALLDALKETAEIFSKDNENNNWKALVSRHKTLFEGSEQLNGVKDIMMQTEFTSEDAMLVQQCLKS